MRDVGHSVLLLLSLFACGFAQYYGYPYPYNYGGSYGPYYPVSSSYYRPSPCRSSCGNIRPTSHCQYLPCYAQQQYHTDYTPYVSPYTYYNSRKTVSPYMSYYNNIRKSSDPYANIPVEIIDDESVLQHRLRPAKFNKHDQYANIPVEIIDDGNYDDFWKNIPVLPKTNKAPQSNYTVSHGAITSNSVQQNKPINAVITRSFQPLQRQPKIKIDFLNGKTVEESENTKSTNEGNEEAEVVTESEVATTETNEIMEEEDEDVKPVKTWGFL